ncbi:MAG: iron ABC transporter permease [Bdellovibrionota bacterium]
MAGAILALCGGVLQKILKNPLADPFILGISSGGSCFAALFVLLNFSSFFYLTNLNKYFPLQSIVSLLGCLFSFYFINKFRKKIKAQHQEYSYLIIGIILNAFFSAVLMITISLADQTQLSQIHNWLVGCLQPVSVIQIMFLILACTPCIFLILKEAPFLNYLLFGDDFAKSLGVNPEKIRNKLIFLICILISIVVSISGAIGFIGLIVPHYVRKMHKGTVFNELVLTMICGSIVLVIADLLSRVLLAPSQLPIGIFTALIGAPSLAFILLRERRV